MILTARGLLNKSYSSKNHLKLNSIQISFAHNLFRNCSFDLTIFAGREETSENFEIHVMGDWDFEFKMRFGGICFLFTGLDHNLVLL